MPRLRGLGTGLALLDGVSKGGAGEGYHLLHAARGSLLDRLGRPREAADAYDRAAQLVARTDTDISFLTGRSAELTVDHPAGPA